jgi:aryl-alcohol dehydrogenase-like predicted oxidoreductase
MNGGSRIGLGGHSYIEQLGNDPRPSFEKQCELVSACLDSGITLLDTTYYQERVALGEVMQALGRRDEAAITAWNFFRQPGREDELVPYTPYEPHHIDVMLEELQTEYVDLIVVHDHDNREGLFGELELAADWVKEGKAKSVGLGMAGLDTLERLPQGHPVSSVLAPYNAFNREAATMFERAKEMGLAAIAMSPFIRGWKLDEIRADREEVAAVLLRWVASQEVVDRVIVSMRRPEWVRANVRAVERGPLSGKEETRLAEWVGRVR